MLDELLRQRIIAPVHESESVPITSPIVLVSKRKKVKKNSENQQNNYISQYKFCCDFRYLNSQINHFCYNIPDLQDLTESFSHKTPNYLTSIDLSSGFFQLPIHSDCQRYTAFNTCFGTFKFLRLPMGLSLSPSSFQLINRLKPAFVRKPKPTKYVMDTVETRHIRKSPKAHIL